MKKHFTGTCFISFLLMAVVVNAGCFGNDSNDEAKRPVWNQGYTWVYEIPDTNRLHIDYITGEEAIDENDCYTIGFGFSEYEDRFGGRGTRYFSKQYVTEASSESGLPHFRDFDFPLKEKKTWENKNTNVAMEGNYSVESIEKVETKAGTFNCFKVVGHLVYRQGDETEYWNRTLYYSSAVKREVKTHITVEHYEPDLNYNATIERSLVMFGHKDSDGDFLADSVETELYHSDPKYEDTDDDGVIDSQDMFPGGDMVIEVSIFDFSTGGNDEHDNGESPTECDPFFVVELRDYTNSELLDSNETDHLQDQDVVHDVVILLDLPEEKDSNILGPQTNLIVIIQAWDDDSQDTTDSDGDDEVNINDDDDDFASVVMIELPRAIIYSAYDGGNKVNEGEPLNDSGSDNIGGSGDVRGGAITYTLKVVNADI